jgi:hypothetical protein
LRQPVDFRPSEIPRGRVTPLSGPRANSYRQSCVRSTERSMRRCGLHCCTATLLETSSGNIGHICGWRWRVDSSFAYRCTLWTGPKAELNEHNTETRFTLGPFLYMFPLALYTHAHPRPRPLSTPTPAPRVPGAGATSIKALIEPSIVRLTDRSTLPLSEKRPSHPPPPHLGRPRQRHT